MDTEGVIRTKGRIDAAVGVPEYMKRSVILPGGHRITQLLVDYYHRTYHHVHAETVANSKFENSSRSEVSNSFVSDL